MKRVYLVFPGIWNNQAINTMKSCVKSLGIDVDYSATVNPNCNQVVYIDYTQPENEEEEDLFMSALEDAVYGIVYTTEINDVDLWDEHSTYFNY